VRVHGLLRGGAAAAPLAEEARDPRRTMHRAVPGTALGIGLFYVVTTYAITVYVDPDRFGTFGASGGASTSTHTTATLRPPLPEKVWIWQLDRTRRTALFRARESDIEVELPLDPMHGTVGVAPANLGVRSALVPDAHGGNMDTPEMRAGVTCYLGVNVEGAMLSLGDGHARQGDGETCGGPSSALRTPW
jgi:hypothetical protein